MCSFTVINGHRLSCCVQTPIPLLIKERSFSKLFPKMRASPEVGFSLPVKIEIVVLFPAPFEPSKAVTSPSYMDIDRPFRASTPFGYTFLRTSSCTVGIFRVLSCWNRSRSFLRGSLLPDNLNESSAPDKNLQQTFAFTKS